MQQMVTYWQSVIPQRVSGVFTHIIRRADCVPLLWFPVLAMVVMVPESRVARCAHCALWGGCCL